MATGALSPTPESRTPLPASPTFDTPPGVYTAITVGARHACALTESGEAVCWGVASGSEWETPPGPYAYITAEGDTSCAVTEAGEIGCWSSDGEPWRPDDLPPGRYSTVGLSDGYIDRNDGYNCALTDTGEAVCWGSDAAGWPDPPPGPFVAIGKASRFRALGGDLRNICALTDAGDGVCWGTFNEERFVEEVAGEYVSIKTRTNGLCGLTTDGQSSCMTLRPDPLVRYTAMSTSGLHDCAITEAGDAVCSAASADWTAGGVMRMNPPDPSPERYAAVSVGGGSSVGSNRDTAYACALTDGGTAVCWGNVENKVKRPDPSPGRYVAVSDGNGHTCALTEDGEAVCWGWNNFGQVNVPPGRYTAISAGILETCAITDVGEAVCWGGYWGLDPSPGTYIAISTGGNQACALTEVGEAVCWDSSDRTSEGPLAEAPPRAIREHQPRLVRACLRAHHSGASGLLGPEFRGKDGCPARSLPGDRRWSRPPHLRHH